MLDITTLSFRQLQGELKKRGIKAKGKKAALQNLLQKDEDRLQSEESSTTAPSTKTTTKKAAAAQHNIIQHNKHNTIQHNTT